MSNGSYLFGGPAYVDVECEKCGKDFNTTAWCAKYSKLRLCPKCEKRYWSRYKKKERVGK